MKVAIVSPVHIQPSSEWIQALVKIKKADEADIILVDDSNGKLDLPFIFDVYDYQRQHEAMHDELYRRFEQFHKSSACKQFGLWQAYQLGYDVVIVIDSDCNVYEGFVEGHLKALSGRGQGWENPLKGTDWFSRGFPYSQRDLPIGAHMGLWDNEWDLYGNDRVASEEIGKPFIRANAPDMEIQTPAGIFPWSGMNVSFKREVIPYMLFLPNFTNDSGEFFTRHDDIWGGYIFQKILRAKGYALSYGAPYVYHDTVVVPEEDAAAEIPMIKHEDEFFDTIDRVLHPELVRDLSAAEIFEHLRRNFRNDSLNQLEAAFSFQELAYAEI